MPQSTKLPIVLLLGALFAIPAANGQSAPPKGEDLFKALGCRGCHRVADNGGNLGPALDGAGNRLSPEQWRTFLTVRRQGSAMPSFAHLTETELEALLGYLRGL